MSCCGLHGPAVIRVQERFEAATEQLVLTAIDHLRYRPAHVATSIGAEHQDEIRGRGDEAPEVGGLSSRRENQRPTQQKGGKQPGRTEHSLENDQMIDVEIGGACKGSSSIERDVRRQGREDSKSQNRIFHPEPLVRRQSNVLH